MSNLDDPDRTAEELPKLDEYILATSASNYAESVGKSLKDFKLVCVDFYNHYYISSEEDMREELDKAKKSLYEKGRELKAEVITDLKLSISYPGEDDYRPVYLVGTALIRR